MHVQWGRAFTVLCTLYALMMGSDPIRKIHFLEFIDYYNLNFYLLFCFVFFSWDLLSFMLVYLRSIPMCF